MLWFGQAVATAFLTWLFLAIAHQHRQDRTPRCPNCHRPFCSPLDLRMHTLRCQLATGSEPTRRSPAARAASAPLYHRGGSGSWH